MPTILHEMTSIIPECPHCRATHVQVVSHWNGLASENIRWIISQCQNPRCGNLVLEGKENSSGLRRLLFPLGSFQLPTGIQISNALREDFQEAGLCLAAGCFKASLVMSRRALQRCLREQGCNQRNLVDSIDTAINNGILRKSFHDLAEEIRQYGNLGAHPDDEQLENVNYEAAHQVLEFTRLLIDEFYELPAKAAKLKAKRTLA